MNLFGAAPSRQSVRCEVRLFAFLLFFVLFVFVVITCYYLKAFKSSTGESGRFVLDRIIHQRSYWYAEIYCVAAHVVNALCGYWRWCTRCCSSQCERSCRIIAFVGQYPSPVFYYLKTGNLNRPI